MLRVPDDLRYSCVQCGRCCTDFDDVEVDVASAERLRRLPLFNPRLEALAGTGDQLPYVPAEGVASGYVLRRVPSASGEERCVFHDDDGLCALHVAHGEEAKPKTCRSFPFQFVDTPGGTFLSASFACTAILHDVGESVTEQKEELEERITYAPDIHDVWEPVMLTENCERSWDEYAELEADLIRLLRNEDGGDLAHALAEQSALIRRAAGLPVPSVDPANDDQTGLRRRAFALALGPLTDDIDRPPLRHPGVEGRIRTLDLPAPPAPRNLVRRFLVHRLFRKDLLRAHSVLFVHNLFLVETALIDHYADAIARRREAAAPDPHDYVEAVRLVEEQFGAHSRFADIAADDDHETAWKKLFDEPGFVQAILAKSLK